VAASSDGASRANAYSLPTNRSLVKPGGMRAILGAASAPNTPGPAGRAGSPRSSEWEVQANQRLPTGRAPPTR
jgi:hypothetical protein